ncbi:MAG: hypothetical protein BWX88_04504 [Planctomycetes bacterium ADurb.Bin126]|nr:MAG: hypothetical protein BWX88_04504 [Planctomycetes bacterium ADurb.Bin126]
MWKVRSCLSPPPAATKASSHHVSPAWISFLTLVICWAVQFSVLASVAPLDSSSTTVTQTSPNMNSVPSQMPAPYGVEPLTGGESAAVESAAASLWATSPARRYGAISVAGSDRVGSARAAASSGETRSTVSLDSSRRSSSRSRQKGVTERSENGWFMGYPMLFVSRSQAGTQSPETTRLFL